MKKSSSYDISSGAGDGTVEVDQPNQSEDNDLKMKAAVIQVRSFS